MDSRNFNPDLLARVEELLTDLCSMEDIIELTAQAGLGDNGAGLYPMYCRREVANAGLGYAVIGATRYYDRRDIQRWIDERATRKAGRVALASQRKVSKGKRATR